MTTTLHPYAASKLPAFRNPVKCAHCSHEIMLDPVLIETGCTFERDALRRWWAQSEAPRCPLTGANSSDLAPKVSSLLCPAQWQPQANV